MGCEGSGNNLGGVWAGETMIRTDCLKNTYFNKKEIHTQRKEVAALNYIKWLAAVLSVIKEQMPSFLIESSLFVTHTARISDCKLSPFRIQDLQYHHQGNPDYFISL